MTRFLIAVSFEKNIIYILCQDIEMRREILILLCNLLTHCFVRFSEPRGQLCGWYPKLRHGSPFGKGYDRGKLEESSLALDRSDGGGMFYESSLRPQPSILCCGTSAAEGGIATSDRSDFVTLPPSVIIAFDACPGHHHILWLAPERWTQAGG